MEQLPEDTLFTLDRYEGNFAVCENRTTGETFDIPKSLVDLSAKEGSILRLENGIYQIDSMETEKQREIIKDLVEKTTKSQ